MAVGVVLLFALPLDSILWLEVFESSTAMRVAAWNTSGRSWMLVGRMQNFWLRAFEN